MATKIVTKNSSTASAAPTASDLVQGELAVNVTDKRLYTENASGAIVELGTNPLGAVTMASTLGVTGVLTATSLDISGDIDVDGTTNLDVVDIDGAVDMASTLAVTGAATFSSTIAATSATFTPSSGENVVITRDSAGPYFGTSSNHSLRFITNNAVALAIAADGSLSTPTAGTSNFRAGVNAGNSIASGGVSNVLLGDEAGTAIITGSYNVIAGHRAGDALDTGSNNVALGWAALTLDTKGDKSTAVGRSALASQNFTSATDSYNTALGYSAGAAITSGASNTFVGGLAGDGTDDGASNTAVGYLSLSANAGDQNTAVGDNSLGVVTGDSNTAIGRAAGLQITSGGNNIAIGVDALRSGSPGGAQTTASNKIGLGDENISSANIQVDWTVASDARDKTDFTALDLGLDFVKALAPVTYKWDKRSKYGDKTADGYDLAAQSPDGTHKEDWLDIGFKAQEVEALEIAAGYNKSSKTNLVSSHTDDGKQMGLQYSKFVPILVKAIQEQNALIEALTARIVTLEG